MSKLLTIGIPAYNVEKYLPDCLNSVLQPEILENLEVLVINDGSTDATESVAKDFARRFPQTVRVITKPNGGWGSGVNRAMREATGLYFKNLDSDDWMDPNGLKKLLENLKLHPVDALFSPAMTVQDGTGKISPYQFPNGVEYNHEMAFCELCESVDFLFRMQSVCFRTEILQKQNITLGECYYSDMELISYPFEFVNTVYVQPEPVYYYRLGRNGQSMSLPSMAKHVEDIRRVAVNMVQWYKRLEQKNLEPACREYFCLLTKTAVSGYLTQPLSVREKERQNALAKELREFQTQIIEPDQTLREEKYYSFFAKSVMRDHFRSFGFWSALWCIYMGPGAAAASAVWNAARKWKSRK